MRIYIGVSTIISAMFFGLWIYGFSGPSDDAGPGWELVYSEPMGKTVAVDVDSCYNEDFMARLLDQLVGKLYRSKHMIVDVYFFDDKQYTPTTSINPNHELLQRHYKLTDEQLLHFRAVYHCIPGAADDFYYVEITDCEASPPEFLLQPASIHPGFVGEPTEKSSDWSVFPEGL